MFFVTSLRLPSDSARFRSIGIDVDRPQRPPGSTSMASAGRSVAVEARRMIATPLNLGRRRLMTDVAATAGRPFARRGRRLDLRQQRAHCSSPPAHRMQPRIGAVCPATLYRRRGHSRGRRSPTSTNCAVCWQKRAKAIALRTADMVAVFDTDNLGIRPYTAVRGIEGWGAASVWDHSSMVRPLTRADRAPEVRDTRRR